LSNLNNTLIHTPNPIDRELTEAQASRVLDVLRNVTHNDPQQELKVLLNILGLLVARNFDNPDDIAKIIQGIPMYINAYRKGSAQGIVT
jgi:hypothetical protein